MSVQYLYDLQKHRQVRIQFDNLDDERVRQIGDPTKLRSEYRIAQRGNQLWRCRYVSLESVFAGLCFRERCLKLFLKSVKLKADPS